MRAAVYSPNFGGILTIVGKGYPADADVREVIAGRATPDRVDLSADGRAWVDAWHSGPEAGDAVYVERHGRGAFHGWVDAVSRRLVQAG
jgi:hypothetical protein